MFASLQSTPKETFTNSPESVEAAVEWCEDPDFLPRIADNAGECCNGTAVQNETTAQILEGPPGWICTLFTISTDEPEDDPTAAPSSSANLVGGVWLPVLLVAIVQVATGLGCYHDMSDAGIGMMITACYTCWWF